MSKVLSEKKIKRIEKRKLKREKRKERNKTTYRFSLVSLILGVAGLLCAFIVKTIPFDFSGALSTVHNAIWNSIVYELFTFILWLYAMIIVFIVLLVFYLVSLFAGPLLAFVGFIFSIVQICANRKWWSWVTIFTSIGFLILAVYLFSLGGNVL